MTMQNLGAPSLRTRFQGGSWKEPNSIRTKQSGPICRVMLSNNLLLMVIYGARRPGHEVRVPRPSPPNEFIQQIFPVAFSKDGLSRPAPLLQRIPDTDFYPTTQLVKADGCGWGACAMVVAKIRGNAAGQEFCRLSLPRPATWQLGTTYVSRLNSSLLTLRD